MTTRRKQTVSTEYPVCGLCGERHVQLSVPERWKDAQALSLVTSHGITPTTKVCAACRKDTKRCLVNNQLIPRWVKQNERALQCCDKDCTDKAIILKGEESLELEKAFEVCDIQAMSSIPVPTPLCIKHYNKVYKILHPVQTNCAVCDKSLRYDTPKYCPNPTIIEEYLRETSDFDKSINASDLICYTCYRSHLLILTTEKNHVSQHQNPSINLKLEDFFETRHESQAWQEMLENIDAYMLHKVTWHQSEGTETLTSMQEFLSLLHPTHTEKSNVNYLKVMDAVADSKDTMMSMLQDLHQHFIVELKLEHLVVEGDAKLFEILQSLKHEYGNELKWLLPFPGDWHILKNYQIALLKPYYEAGLKEMAQAAGYPLNQIKHCSHFKRTHTFILEAWEALYRTMILAYTTQQEAQLNMNLLANALTQVKESRSDWTDHFHSLQGLLKSNLQKFKSFLQKMASTDYTWRFWIRFVFEDAMAYVCLFLAVRSGNWHLRTSSIRQMAFLFTSFDHTTYQKVLSEHLTDLQTMPQTILAMFKHGAFTVSISGREWHSVAVDEAHEMLINKGCKASLIKPSPDYINRVATYLPYRSRMLENIRLQLFPEQSLKETPSNRTPLISKDASTVKFEGNVRMIQDSIRTTQVFITTSTNRGLFNLYSKKAATEGQTKDLLTFRSIGREEFFLRIAYFKLREPSIQAPNRRQRLQTFSDRTTKTVKKVSQLDEDKRLVLSAMKKKLQHSKKTGTPIEQPGEQLIEYPLSICDNKGNPLKGNKSYTTNVLETRYQSAQPSVIIHSCPIQQTCTIIDGMFLINTAPLGIHRTLADYARFLVQRHITPHFQGQGREVHIIFDTPGRLESTPKCFEQEQRDKVASLSKQHCCDDLTGVTAVRREKWRENLIHCRQCKRNLVLFLGKFLLNKIQHYLQPHQQLFVTGAFEGDIIDTTWFVKGKNTPQPHPGFYCRAEEADTKIWLHVKQTDERDILIISADTDVYQIGLPLPYTQVTSGKHIVCQINPIHSRQLRYLDVNALNSALRNDPDLSSINPTTLPNILQTLYATSGCDYISFFSRIGKASFLRYFYQHAAFITAGKDSTTPGQLSQVGLTDNSYQQGYLAFLRLIGTIYFKRYPTGFKEATPKTHFETFLNPTKTTKEQHYEWLNSIRETVWERAQFENEMVASNDALFLHWKRTCWVLHMWAQADQPQMVLQPINSYGWTMSNQILTIKWDSEANMKAVRERVDQLLRGCRCSTGCTNGRCGCRRNGKKCSIGCECQNCTNTKTSPSSVQDMNELALSLEEDTDLEVDELMDWTFSHTNTAETELTDDNSDLSQYSDSEQEAEI